MDDCNITQMQVTKEYLVGKMQYWFTYKSGGADGIILGMSGGKDSTVCAALWSEAIGSDHVFGVIMPNGRQHDLEEAIAICKALNISYEIREITDIYNLFLLAGKTDKHPTTSKEANINIAPRIRMTLLREIGQTLNYRLSNTTNASELYVGYGTKDGDLAGDVHPLMAYTCTEVIQIGKLYDSIAMYVDKPPADGLTNKTDEEVFGFTYSQLDDYISSSNKDEVMIDAKIVEKIERMHNSTRHKIGGANIL